MPSCASSNGGACSGGARSPFAELEEKADSSDKKRRFCSSGACTTLSSPGSARIASPMPDGCLSARSCSRRDSRARPSKLPWSSVGTGSRTSTTSVPFISVLDGPSDGAKLSRSLFCPKASASDAERICSCWSNSCSRSAARWAVAGVARSVARSSSAARACRARSEVTGTSSSCVSSPSCPWAHAATAPSGSPIVVLRGHPERQQPAANHTLSKRCYAPQMGCEGAGTRTGGPLYSVLVANGKGEALSRRRAVGSDTHQGAYPPESRRIASCTNRKVAHVSQKLDIPRSRTIVCGLRLDSVRLVTGPSYRELESRCSPLPSAGGLGAIYDDGKERGASVIDFVHKLLLERVRQVQVDPARLLVSGFAPSWKGSFAHGQAPPTRSFMPASDGIFDYYCQQLQAREAVTGPRNRQVRAPFDTHVLWSIGT
eukprot:scaffold665_cov341-Prasinococcus_capsulatus_cf.AAC.9